MGIFEKFKIGFKKSAANITSGLKELITSTALKKDVDSNLLNDNTDNSEPSEIVWSHSFSFNIPKDSISLFFSHEVKKIIRRNKYLYNLMMLN